MGSEMCIRDRLIGYSEDANHALVGSKRFDSLDVYIHALVRATMAYIYAKLVHRETIAFKVFPKTNGFFAFQFSIRRKVEHQKKPHDMITIKAGVCHSSIGNCILLVSFEKHFSREAVVMVRPMLSGRTTFENDTSQNSTLIKLPFVVLSRLSLSPTQLQVLQWEQSDKHRAVPLKLSPVVHSSTTELRAK